MKIELEAFRCQSLTKSASIQLDGHVPYLVRSGIVSKLNANASLINNFLFTY